MSWLMRYGSPGTVRPTIRSLYLQASESYLYRLALGAFVASIRVALPLVMTRVDLPIGELSVAQKLDLMERLWADLSANESAMPSPEWHGTVIADRLQPVEEGQARYGDWNEAKTHLRQKLQ